MVIDNGIGGRRSAAKPSPGISLSGETLEWVVASGISGQVNGGLVMWEGNGKGIRGEGKQQ